MIEAINSTIANAQLMRGAVEQQTERAARPEPQEAVDFVQAPFISPVISIDTEYNTAVLLLRNSESGEVVDQIPSESALQSDNRTQAPETEIRSIQSSSEFVRLQQSTNSGSSSESVSTQQQSRETNAGANTLAALQSFEASQAPSQLGGNVSVEA